VDFDGDGVLDMVSGCYDPGDVYLFRGLGRGEYEAGKPILDEAGVPLVHHPREYVEFTTKYEKTKEKNSEAALQARVASFGSWPAVVDWDGDGDLDVLIGSFGGGLFLRANLGTRSEPRYAKDSVAVEAGGRALQVHGHAAPAVGDWDADGTWDVIVGADDGSVAWFRNGGTKTAPRLEAGRTLLPARARQKFITQYLRPGEEPQRGVRHQICVTDYDGDGKLDLIVGDHSSVRREKEGLAAAERERLAALIAKERELQAGGAAAKELAAVIKQKDAFYEDLGNQSFVWLFLRR
jgi:hypothetical protein